MNKWTKHYLQLAKQTAQLSKDPSSKIGAIAVGRKKQVLSTGYNGFPRGIKDLHSRLSTRETKYKYVVHAEQNLIYNACYTGTSLDSAILYLYGLPLCSECAKGIIQVGISNGIMQYDPDNRWNESFQLTKSMLDEVNISYELWDLNGLQIQ